MMRPWSCVVAPTQLWRDPDGHVFRVDKVDRFADRADARVSLSPVFKGQPEMMLASVLCEGGPPPKGDRPAKFRGWERLPARTQLEDDAEDTCLFSVTQVGMGAARAMRDEDT